VARDIDNPFNTQGHRYPMDSTLTAPQVRAPATQANEARGQIRLRDFATLALQLGLILLLLRQFQIESPAFRILVMLAFAGFAIHSFLPLPARHHSSAPSA
jgi:hypothetical protein